MTHNLNSETDMQVMLLDRIRNAITETVSDTKIGMAFSGGVDSTLMAKISHDMGYDVTLLTIGFAASHDILFAKKINDILQLPHHTLEIELDGFAAISKRINQTINVQNLSWNENCIAFYYISMLARKLGIGTVVTANGIDELFCGYNAYREVFSKDVSRIPKVINEKLENEIAMMKAVNIIASEFDVRMVQPLLTVDFIEYAKSIPIEEKITGSEDIMRKHIIRRLASEIGVPEPSYAKRKKALQYGTRIHKELLKTR